MNRLAGGATWCCPILRYLVGWSLCVFFSCWFVQAEEMEACSLDPGLLTVVVECEQGQISEEMCHWIPILKSLAVRQIDVAVSSLEQRFNISRDRAGHFIQGVDIFLLPLLYSDCPMGVGAELAKEVFENIAKIPGMRGSVESYILMSHLFSLDSDALEKLRTTDPVPEEFDRVSEASIGLVELLEYAGLRQRLVEAAENNPSLGRMPDTSMGSWSSELAHLAPGLNRVDEILNQMSVTSTKETRSALADLAQSSSNSLQQGAILARAGLGFLQLGQFEDALAYMQQSVEVLDQVESPLGHALQQQAGFLQVHVLRGLGRSAEGQVIETDLSTAKLNPLMELFLSEEWRDVSRLEVSAEERTSKLMIVLDEVVGTILSDRFLNEELGPAMQALEVIAPNISEMVSIPSRNSRSSFLPVFKIFSLSATGEAEEALKSLDQWIAEGPNYFQAWVAIVVGQEALKKQEMTLALAAIDRAVVIFERGIQDGRVDEITRTLIDLLGSNLHSAAMSVALLSGQPDVAFGYAEQGRAFSTRQLVGAPGFASHGSGASILESKIENEIVRTMRDANGEVDIAAVGQRFATARLQRKLAQAGPEAPQDSQEFDLKMIQGLLGPKEFLLSYFWNGRSLNVWVISRNSVHWDWEKWPESRVEEIRCVLSNLNGQVSTGKWFRAERGAVAREACGFRDETSGTAQTLYQWLVAPFLKEIPIGSRLLIAPHGLLHRVPWGALRNASGQRLIEEFEISVIPSASLLYELRSRQENAQGIRQPSAMVLGDPTTHLSPLPAARYEAAVVAELLGVEPLLAERATEAAVYVAAPEVDVLHIAAHGIYEREAPLFSRLHLAEGDGHDGFLHLHEIWDRLDLRKTRLVVLSACETASGEPTQGDDIVGLTQAFLVAGSQAVISTLWPVDDPASALLMVSFYRGLQAGMTVGQALRAAQLELSQKDEFEDPYYWAGYILVGDPETRWLPSKHREVLRPRLETN